MSKKEKKLPDVGDELFFGLVGAVGTDLDKVSEILTAALKKVGYNSIKISMSKLLHSQDGYEKLSAIKHEDERISKHMDAGNEFREKTKTADALTLLSVTAIWKERRKRNGSSTKPLRKTAFIFKSLKHPEEVGRFRAIYGSSFHLISVYSSRDVRLENLTIQIKDSYGDAHSENYLGTAEDLINRDESERDENEYGQNVRDTYPYGDVFVDANEPKKLQNDIERFVELLFGNTTHTPTKDEFAMFIAQASGKRSGSLARQVGAVIANDDGDILAAGMNEVPKFGGGLFGPEDDKDYRNLKLGHDPNDIRKRQILKDILERLNELCLIRKDKIDVDSMLEKYLPKLKKSDLMSIIEFAREVHAEMAALTSAARHTISVRNCTLYTTTFPCHDCAKHIIATGIKRVVYEEPYPKSLTKELFRHMITVEEKLPRKDTVVFQPFVGIADSRYMTLFTMNERKDPSGKMIPWTAKGAAPRIWEMPSVYVTQEVYALIDLMKSKIKLGLTREDEELIKRFREVVGV